MSELDIPETASTSSEGKRRKNGLSKDTSKKRKSHDEGDFLLPDGANGRHSHGHGHGTPTNGKRRASISRKPARDFRDKPEGASSHKKRKKNRDAAAAAAGGGLDAEAQGEAEAEAEAETETRSPSPLMIDFDGLSRPSVGTRERLEESAEQRAERVERIRGAVQTLLSCVGEDVGREGLLATPRRYAEAMLHFTKGYQENVRDIVNGAIFNEGHNEMVIVKDIDIYSLCEHHLVPFVGKIHIGYIPRDAVIGISKLPRIAEMFARRLQIQERLTREVATAIMEVLQPQGVGVVMESTHFCTVMRGVQKASSKTITSCMLGCFEKRQKTRSEFLSLIGFNR